MFNLCEKRIAILNTNNHLLIEGGPGSGKTTIALLKANSIVNNGGLERNQKILFLSFARATTSRVEEHAKNLMPKSNKKSIEINTYHGFSWNLLQSFGYLIGKHKILKIITPQNLAVRLSDVEDSKKIDFQKDLLRNEGLISFDLFSGTLSNILIRSSRVRRLISDSYPYIIVDEFQDTNEEEWEIIKSLGENSTIIALADIDQRIYEFRGASITRIPEFIEYFDATKFDLGFENNRSNGTDIVQYGNDILTGSNRRKKYNNVLVKKYAQFPDPKLNIKASVMEAINRLRRQKIQDWSIAVLVGSKYETLAVSKYLSIPSKIPVITHEVLIDPAGPYLSAQTIALLMAPIIDQTFTFVSVLRTIINHIKGRKANLPKKDLALITALENYINTGKISGKNRLQLIQECKDLVINCSKLDFKGIPGDDWISVRKLFEHSHHPNLKNIFEDAQYLRLLNKGAILSEKLSEMWRLEGTYTGASRVVEEALVQEHFSMTNRKWKGVFVMTIHKSKGKEFDEVVIWDDLYRPLVPADASENRIQQAKLMLRVGVTRAKTKTTILTPSQNSCILI